jgi:hypothetical protein
MNNIKQIIDSFDGFVQQHPILQTFTWGRLSDTGRNNEPLNFPLLHVIPLPSTVDQTYTDFTFNVIIADLLDDQELNQLDVIEEAYEILQDFITYYINGLSNETFFVNPPITFTPFLDRFTKVMAGVEAQITLRVEGSYCL